MDIGICTGYYLRTGNSVNLASHPDMIPRIEELNTQHHRIPFVWARMQKKVDGKLLWQDDAVSQIQCFLNELPKGRTVLAVLTNPPKEVAAAYFDDQSVLAPLFSEFVAGCIDRFPGVHAWEIGNEPNGSDFYLSIGDKGGHRPWTPAEYVQHLLVPGATIIREKRPDAKISVAAVAENGIVGHKDKSYCLSNLLPLTPRFSSMRSKVPHGQFYFIPGFAYPLFAELKKILDMCRESGRKPLFDAIALHPYPYHEIQKKKNPDLLAESVLLIEDFVAAAKEAGLEGVECWITEVGCRSLNVPEKNKWSEDDQARFVDGFLNNDVVKKSISRVYWYQLIDTDYDMRQEKTFGLLDHLVEPKKAFYALQKNAVENREVLDVLRDDFTSGVKFGHGGVNDTLWSVSSSTVFAYVIASAGGSSKPEAALCPGRNEGAWIELKSKKPFSVSQNAVYSVDLGYRLTLPNDRYLMAIAFWSAVNPESIFTLEIANTTDSVFSVKLKETGEEAALTKEDYPFVGSSTITGIRVLVSARSAVITLRFGEMFLQKTFALPAGMQVSAMHLGFRLVQLHRRSGFASLSGIVAQEFSGKDSLASLTQENRLAENTWILSVNEQAPSREARQAVVDGGTVRLMDTLGALQRNYSELSAVAAERQQAIGQLAADKTAADQEIAHLADELQICRNALGQEISLRTAAEVDALAAKSTRGYRVGQAFNRLIFWKRG